MASLVKKETGLQFAVASPNVLGVYDVWTSQFDLFMVFELGRFGTLEDRGFGNT